MGFGKITMMRWMLAAAAMFMLTGAAQAANVNWIGGATGDTTNFQNGDNWANGSVPTGYEVTSGDATDIAIFDGSRTGLNNKTPTLTADYWLYGLVFEDSGWTLDTGSHALSVSWRPSHSIQSNATNGINTINGTVKFGGYDTNYFSDIDVASGGTLRLNADISITPDHNGGGNTSGGLDIRGPGTVELNTTGILGNRGLRIYDGTVRLLSETAGGMTGDGTGGLGTGHNRTLLIDGGTLDVNGATSSLNVGILAVHAGGELTNSSSTIETISILTSSGQTLSGLISGNLNMVYEADAISRTNTITHANTYTGSTEFQRGTWLVENANGSATGDGNVIVQKNAVLGGNGFITGDVTVQNEGTLAPGKSIGTLSVGSTTIDGGVFKVELGDGVSDLLAVNGDLTLDNGALLDLLGTADNATSYVIATYTGVLSGTFASPVLPTGYSIDYGSGANSQITLLVPEPTTLMLMGVGGVMMLSRRRRRS